MPNMQLSKNLITLRKIHNFTQDDLSKILHVSRQAYSNYENMKRNPDLESILLICSLYHISIDELVNHNIGSSFNDSNFTSNIAMDISTANTLYLSPDETYLVMNYRNMDKEKRSSVKSLVDTLAR